MAMVKLVKLIKQRKRVARGIAGKGGKTAGRGTKGQLSRTGSKTYLPKQFLKLPKLRGFKSRQAKPFAITYRSLTAFFKSGEKVTPERLTQLGLVAKGIPVKIIGPVTDEKKLKFAGVKLTKSFRVK